MAGGEVSKMYFRTPDRPGVSICKILITTQNATKAKLVLFLTIKPGTKGASDLILLNGLLHDAQRHCNCSVVNLRYSVFVPSMTMLISLH